MKNIVLCMLCLLSASLFSQNSKIYHLQTGQFDLYTLNEKSGTGDTSLLIGATPQMIRETIPGGIYPNAMSCFLLEIKGFNDKILFDTGLTADSLLKNLNSLNIKPEEITEIFITHAHRDHIGGLLKDGKALFPELKALHISYEELRYWLEEKNDPFVKKIVEEYDTKLKVFVSGENLEDSPVFNRGGESLSEAVSIKSWAAFGHTPGHNVFLIGGYRHKNNIYLPDYKLMIWGDLTHASAIQMRYPEVAVKYDIDPVQAVQSRLKIFKYLAEYPMKVAGMHIPFPSVE